MEGEMKNVFEAFSDSLYLSKFYLNSSEKLKEFSFGTTGINKGISWHYFNLTMGSFINSMYIYLCWLIENDSCKKDNKTITINTLLKKYENELGKDLCEKYKNLIDSNKDIIKKVINKRRKLIAHYDYRIAKNGGEKDYIIKNKTEVNKIKIIFSILDSFLNDVEKRFDYVFQNKIAYNEIIENSNIYIDNHIIPLINNDINIHNEIIDTK